MHTGRLLSDQRLVGASTHKCNLVPCCLHYFIFLRDLYRSVQFTFFKSAVCHVFLPLRTHSVELSTTPRARALVPILWIIYPTRIIDNFLPRLRSIFNARDVWSLSQWGRYCRGALVKREVNWRNQCVNEMYYSLLSRTGSESRGQTRCLCCLELEWFEKIKWFCKNLIFTIEQFLKQKFWYSVPGPVTSQSVRFSTCVSAKHRINHFIKSLNSRLKLLLNGQTALLHTSEQIHSRSQTTPSSPKSAITHRGGIANNLISLSLGPVITTE